MASSGEMTPPCGVPAVGRVSDHSEGAELYVAHLLSTLPHRLEGLRVVVDGANGAAASVGPDALRRARRPAL